MNTIKCEMGIIGLGVMGGNLLLNMAEKGFPVAGYNKDPSKVDSLRKESQKLPIHCTTDIKEFIDLLRRPRAIMLLVPAGPTVDSVIQDLLPYLEPGDIIIDAGNSYFKDTDIRAKNLLAKGIQFLGMGVSGGEAGARHGPSLMPGGSKESYARVQVILEAIAAKVKNEPCVTHLGPGASGHFVKMIHNGIEYGIMQLIAESYDLMKRGLGLNNDQLQAVYSEWNQGELNSYLMEITSKIFGKMDDKTSKKLIDNILAVAEQLGTGMWTTQSGMELQVPAQTIDIAVTMRDLSMLVKDRLAFSTLYPRASTNGIDNSEKFIASLREAIFISIIMVYAQGFAILRAASDKYAYALDLKAIARIWRGGCIIRASLLDDICEAFHTKKDLSNLLLAPNLSPKINEYQKSLRNIVSQAIKIGIPVPGLMSALGYLDAFRSQWLPANLIQAQRDYFGSHTYQRIDMPGSFHTEWEKK